MSTLPDTSLEAHRKVSPEMLTNHHSKIIEALKKIKSGMYEDISVITGMEKHQIGRRLKELETMQIVYKPGEKRNTSAGRSAYIYKLVDNGQVSAQPEKMLPGTSIADYSRKLVPVQKNLFEDDLQYWIDDDTDEERDDDY